MIKTSWFFNSTPRHFHPDLIIINVMMSLIHGQRANQVSLRVLWIRHQCHCKLQGVHCSNVLASIFTASWRYLINCLLTKGASLKRHLATILLKKKIIQQFYRVKETSWLSLLLQQKDILRICHTADILIGPTKQSCKASWPIFTIIAGGILLLLWDFFVGFMMLYSFQ